MIEPWHLYLMALIYFIAGLNHFRVPKIYYKIIPPFFSNKKFFNAITGILEIILSALLLFPATKNYACYGIILLLIAIFPANIYMLTNEKASFKLPKWVLIVRLPLQILLMLWAYYYTS